MNNEIGRKSDGGTKRSNTAKFGFTLLSSAQFSLWSQELYEGKSMETRYK